MLLLHKLLPLFVLPLGVVLIAIIVGTLVRKQVLLWYAALVLWAFSIPTVADGLMHFVEGNRTVALPQTLHQADAIVVLGGMIRHVEGAAEGEWNDAADRFEAGVTLYRAGKAPLLLFTRGRMPWSPDAVPEGELLVERALQRGVPEAALGLTAPVANTEDEAADVARLLRERGAERIILVTSAYHMRRSQLLFEHTGLSVEPYPVDFRVDSYPEPAVLRFAPSAEALYRSELALRELIGWLYYRVKLFFG